MGWKLLFKPKPRCLRDKLELWLVGSKRGQFYYVNLAGMIPFAAVPVGLVIGLIVSFLVEKDVHTGWHLPVRYVPLLLGPGLAAIIGRIVTGAIIDGYYIDHSPFDDNQEAIERIMTRSGGKPSRKGVRKRRQSVEDDD